MDRRAVAECRACYLPACSAAKAPRRLFPVPCLALTCRGPGPPAASFSLPAPGAEVAAVTFVEAQPPEALAIVAEQNRQVRGAAVRRRPCLHMEHGLEFLEPVPIV